MRFPTIFPLNLSLSDYDMVTFLLGLLVGSAAVWLMLTKGKGALPGVPAEEASDGGNPGEEPSEADREQVLEAMGRVMDLIKERGEADSGDVQELLEVSEAVAAEYLAILADDGRIEPSGERDGRTLYKLK